MSCSSSVAGCERPGQVTVLATRSGGYQLRLRPEDLDARVFVDLVREARDQPPDLAAATLERALALWRGAAYTGFADTEVAQLEALSLEEARRIALERRAAALLASGCAEDVVLLLEPFVAQHPLRDDGRITLMRALHAVGRTADALEHFHRHRENLAEELGLEPSAAVQGVHLELLRNPTPTPATPEVPEQRRAPPGQATQCLAQLEVRYLRTDRGPVVAYGRCGSGPPLVVLLGWVSSLDVIASGRDPRSSLLERLTGNLSLTLYDRWGTGLSPGPVTDFGLEASVQELIDVLRAVGPPVSLLAMSAAGPIAVSLAARLPSWVSSLVLFGTFASGPATFTDKALRDTVVQIARSHWGIGSKLLADLYRPGVTDEAAWHLARVFRESATPEVAAEYLASMYDHDVIDLPAVTAPSLVLHYRGDRLIGFRGGQDLATGLPHAGSSRWTAGCTCRTPPIWTWSRTRSCATCAGTPPTPHHLPVREPDRRYRVRLPAGSSPPLACRSSTSSVIAELTSRSRARISPGPQS